MNVKKLGNCGPTSCPKIGIKIHESGNSSSSRRSVRIKVAIRSDISDRHNK